MALADRVRVTLAEQRTARPWLDHVLRMQQHYGAVNGNGLAGAVTFFGFLSFFPLLALSFFVVGYLAAIYPDAQDNLVSAIQSVFPGMIGEDDGQISLADLESAAGALGLVGLLGVLYSGLGWLSGLRESLRLAFEKPAEAKPSFVVGKLRDLVTLGCIGFVLLFSVAVSSGLNAFSGELLDLIGLGEELAPLLRLLTVVIGIGASSLLFMAIFRLLARPDVPVPDLWRAALFGAVGFEVLKQVAGLLLESTRNQPAFQAFGIALILLVWINYFARLTVYAASWAHTSTSARLRREVAAAAEHARHRAERVPLEKPDAQAVTVNQAAARSFALGSAFTLALAGLLRRAARR